jgi:RNA polymerase sigma factor (sigma-70 family)
VLQSLSPQQRSVLVLRYYEGLGEAQIADALDVSVGTVRQHAARGLRHLRALMIPTDAPEEAHSREEH